mmetsp:Transcript_23034/g.72930  ORF Transcript_23034/g.72930 Transcript_23034/m.72930 type:complete len:282 (+) Transcript_23034:89-934(+)
MRCLPEQADARLVGRVRREPPVHAGELPVVVQAGGADLSERGRPRRAGALPGSGAGRPGELAVAKAQREFVELLANRQAAHRARRPLARLAEGVVQQRGAPLLVPGRVSGVAWVEGVELGQEVQDPLRRVARRAEEVLVLDLQEPVPLGERPHPVQLHVRVLPPRVQEKRRPAARRPRHHDERHLVLCTRKVLRNLPNLGDVRRRLVDADVRLRASALDVLTPDLLVGVERSRPVQTVRLPSLVGVHEVPGGQDPRAFALPVLRRAQRCDPLRRPNQGQQR